ncbi:MAG TPA: hypothetical protein IAB49_05790 [Candidatus Caccenecus avistercoris]|nr:hypothetical protein [Candidatus Caccenecus avistercoris]
MRIANIDIKNKKFRVMKMGSRCNCGRCNCNCGAGNISKIISNKLQTKIIQLCNA